MVGIFSTESILISMESNLIHILLGTHDESYESPSGRIVDNQKTGGVTDVECGLFGRLHATGSISLMASHGFAVDDRGERKRCIAAGTIIF